MPVGVLGLGSARVAGEGARIGTLRRPPPGDPRTEFASDNRRTIEVLAALSHHGDFSVGCHCQDEACCHRSILPELLLDKGTEVIP